VTGDLRTTQRRNLGIPACVVVADHDDDPEADDGEQGQQPLP
jgi:hypothetical protein